MQQMMIFINFMWCLSKIKSKFHQIVRNRCEFYIYLINVVGWEVAIGFLIHIRIKKMSGVRSIDMISVRSTIPTSEKFLSRAPPPPFRNFFIIYPRK